MNYEEMSDFEVNSAVHNLVRGLGYTLEFPGGNQIKWSGVGEAIVTSKCVYSKSGLHDYCNNPADAWPIIHGNGIGLFERDISGGGKTWTATTNMDKSWLGYGADGFDYTDRNPLRAAMIVFLMMQNVG